MQSEQKVKVGLIKNAIKLASAIKLLHVAINQKSQNGLRRQQQGNESVNTFHYCMITWEKIKSQNKADLTCMCITADYFTTSSRGSFFSICGGCLFVFCIFQQCVTGDLLLMNQGESTGSGPNSWHCCTTCRACRCKNTYLVILRPKDAGTATAHLQSSRKRGWIRRNKLPVDVVGASVNHSPLNQLLEFPIKATSSPPCGIGSVTINGPNWLPNKIFRKTVDVYLGADESKDANIRNCKRAARIHDIQFKVKLISLEILKTYNWHNKSNL